MNDFLSSKGVTGTGGVAAMILVCVEFLQSLYALANPRWYVVTVAALVAFSIQIREEHLVTVARLAQGILVTIVLAAATLGASRGQYDLRQAGADLIPKAEAQIHQQEPTPEPTRRPFDPL